MKAGQLRLYLAALLVPALLLGACGGGDDRLIESPTATEPSSSPSPLATSEVPTTSEVQRFENFGISFEYPLGFERSENGVLGSRADDRSGGITLTREDADGLVRYSVTWIRASSFDLRASLDGGLSAAEASLPGSVRRGEIVADQFAHGEMLSQRFSVGDEMQGALGSAYCEESHLGLAFIVFDGTARLDIVGEFRTFIDSFLCTGASSEPPSNTDADTAEVISALPFAAVADTSLAPTGKGEQSCGPTDAAVWYRFTSESDGAVRVTTEGSDFDTVVSVWTIEGAELTELACNDDIDGLTSAVTVATQVGVAYFVQVAGWSIGGELHIEVVPQ